MRWKYLTKHGRKRHDHYLEVLDQIYLLVQWASTTTRTRDTEAISSSEKFLLVRKCWSVDYTTNWSRWDHFRWSNQWGGEPAHIFEYHECVDIGHVSNSPERNIGRSFCNIWCCKFTGGPKQSYFVWQTRISVLSSKGQLAGEIRWTRRK